MKTLKSTVVVILLSILSQVAMAVSLPDAVYVLSELDRQFPYKHTPNIFSSSYGPYQKASLTIEKNRFAIKMLHSDPEVAQEYPILVFYGALNVYTNSKGEVIVSGKVEQVGLADDDKSVRRVGARGQVQYSIFANHWVDLDAEFIKSFTFMLNGTQTSRLLTYRPWNVKDYVEGTLGLDYLKQGNYLNRRIQVSKDSDRSSSYFYTNTQKIRLLKP